MAHRLASMNPPRPAYAGLFTVSAGALLFQVTLIRMFSAAIWYHFAFLVVSVALFGIGASGVAVAVSRSRKPPNLALAPIGFAISSIASFALVQRVPFEPFWILRDPAQVFWLLGDELLLAIPFFFFGLTVSQVLRTWPERAGRLYAFDLAGAAVGVLLHFLALPLLGVRGSVALGATLGAAAAMLFATRTPTRVLAGAALAASLLLVARPSLLPDVRLDGSKPVVAAAAEPGARLAFTRWSPLARIDVVERPGAPPVIFLDAAAATPMTARRDAATALGDVSALGPMLRPGGSVAVIGAGGGVDVQNALALGARHVTAIEINPVILELVRGHWGNATSDVFSDPRVSVVHDEGRSAIARSTERFDVIQSTLIDTWAASASGAYSLSENYLYTVEAVESFLDHLAPHGVLSITRWYYEAPRLVSVLREALVRRGVADCATHVMVVEERLRTTVLVQNESFGPEDSRRLAEFAGRTNDRVVQHDPFAPRESGFFGEFLRARDPGRFYRQTDLALEPATDDAPFFFQMTRWDRLTPVALARFTGRSILEPLLLPVGQLVLLAALLLSVLLSAGLLAVPLARRAVPREGRWRWLFYFGALGVAYIAVEIALMQRLALLLGHPTYSVALTLFAILLFTGFGALWADRLGASPARIARPLLLALLASLSFVGFVLPRLMPMWMPFALPVRVLLATLVIAPAAFAMGMPFPLAIRALGQERGHVAWGWAANGCGSVVGSVLAVLGAMLAGFTVVLAAAGALYAAALIVLIRAPEARREASPIGSGATIARRHELRFPARPIRSARLRLERGNRRGAHRG